MDLSSLARQLKTRQVPAKKVVFEMEEERWVFDAPQVVEANMMGQIVYQVIGSFKKESGQNEEDLKLIIEKTNCSKQKAESALKKYGDVAEAILHILDE
jgi:NACalpha-BTF3-like transcription factor